MENIHVESDIALLYMMLEEIPGHESLIYPQIHGLFEKMRREGETIPVEFLELEAELEMQFAA